MRFGNALIGLLMLLGTARATGINTNAALPVGEGTSVSRTQLRRLDLEGEVDRYLVSETFARGINGDLTVFGSIGYIWDQPGSNGLTDLALFGRYQLFSRDAERQTLAFSAILGVEIPTGTSPFGGQTTGIRAGLVGTWAKRDWNVDANIVHSFRIDEPDFTRVDLAVSYAFIGTRTLQFVGVLEANYRRPGDNNLLYLAPGLQLQMENFVYEASFQIRVAEDAAGPTARNVAVISLRIVF